jgi:hypothetical protein
VCPDAALSPAKGRENGQCLSAPCPQNAKLRVTGQAQYGANKVNYSFEGQDPDPATASDAFQLTVAQSQYTFSCDGCVEVVMGPGSIPNSVYNGQ